MKGYRKILVGFFGIAALYFGGRTLPEGIYNNYVYGVAGIIITLISGNAAVHFFQNRGKKEK